MPSSAFDKRNQKILNSFLFFVNLRKKRIMLNKSKVIKSLKSLPETFSVDEVIDRIILLQKIELGLEQSSANKVSSSSEAKKKLKKWLK